MTTGPEALKRAAAAAALDHVESDMVLGLGTGSTVRHLLELLAEALESGRLRGIVGVPTSLQTETRARELGIDLVALGQDGRPDVTIDGADEVSPELDLIKGLGGALLREKMVAQASERLIIIADARKRVARLGLLAPVPVEVIEWGLDAQTAFLRGLGTEVALRVGPDGEPLRSDNGHLFLDCRFPDGIDDPSSLARVLDARAGVVDHGLFLGMADLAVIASEEGIEEVPRPR